MRELMRSFSFERAFSTDMFRLGALGLGLDGDFFLVDGDLDTLGFPLALGRFVATFFNDDFSNRKKKTNFLMMHSKSLKG